MIQTFIVSRLRFPLLGFGMLALLTGIWAGIIRIGWPWPIPQPALPAAHGPLMICGFLGTVIGLERAIALAAFTEANQRRWWTYLGPLITALGAGALILGLPGLVGPFSMALGSLMLVVVFGVIVRIQPAIFTVTMAVGALFWLVGNSLWLMGWSLGWVVPWWGGFLVLTIAGERLELSRIRRLTGWANGMFLGSIGFYSGGLLLSLFDLGGGIRLAGIGMLALSIWLLRYDIARTTVKKEGLSRFMAVCLLVGYLWLGLAGLLSLTYGGVTAGFQFDALYHALFVGFVMSMIFAHAPIIFPAIIGKAIPFHTRFYLHLGLLHLSLILRLAGDLIPWLPARQWGGLLNGLALLLFLLNTGSAILRSKSDQG